VRLLGRRKRRADGTRHGLGLLQCCYGEVEEGGVRRIDGKREKGRKKRKEEKREKEREKGRGKEGKGAGKQCRRRVRMKIRSFVLLWCRRVMKRIHWK
jgi:hypothetical protein